MLLLSGIAFKFFTFYVHCWYIKTFLHHDLVCTDLAKLTHVFPQNFPCTELHHLQIKVLILSNPYAL